ncbi:MAG: CHRD domain-containing protein [Solirubrobacteraceae bacterium]
MRPRKSFVVLAIVMLALAGCGSKKKATSAAPANPPSTSATLPPGATVLTAPPPSAKPRTYRVKLSGAAEVPAGAPNGSGIAVISIKGGGELCWKFSALQHVTAPLVAHIHHGLAGTSGPIVIPLGGAYKPAGCVNGTAPQLLAIIELNPQRFYVNIHNAKYPGGAVRAQL